MTNAAVLDEPNVLENPEPSTILVPCLVSIAKTVRQLVSINLSECEVLPGQDQFLLSLSENGDMSVAEIAARLSVRASTVSKMADHLCRRAWAARVGDAEDQRRVRVHLTDEGEAVARSVRRIHARLARELWTAFGDDTALLPSLAKLEGILAVRLRHLR